MEIHNRSVKDYMINIDMKLVVRLGNMRDLFVCSILKKLNKNYKCDIRKIYFEYD